MDIIPPSGKVEMGAKDIYKVVYLGSEKELITSIKTSWLPVRVKEKPDSSPGPGCLILDTSIIVTGQGPGYHWRGKSRSGQADLH